VAEIALGRVVNHVIARLRRVHHGKCQPAIGSGGRREQGTDSPLLKRFRCETSKDGHVQADNMTPGRFFNIILWNVV
jgi:hypothetical protein